MSSECGAFREQIRSSASGNKWVLALRHLGELCVIYASESAYSVWVLMASPHHNVLKTVRVCPRHRVVHALRIKDFRDRDAANQSREPV